MKKLRVLHALRMTFRVKYLLAIMILQLVIRLAIETNYFKLLFLKHWRHLIQLWLSAFGLKLNHTHQSEIAAIHQKLLTVTSPTLSQWHESGLCEPQLFFLLQRGRIEQDKGRERAGQQEAYGKRQTQCRYYVCWTLILKNAHGVL